jgi:uncharacterized protein
MKIFILMRHKRNYYGDEKIKSMVNAYKIDAISIGKRNCSRETDSLLRKSLLINQQVFIVSEAGASVYSASKIVRENFLIMSLSVVRFLIGGRLSDPLAELVKIEPKANSVGQHQRRRPN